MNALNSIEKTNNNSAGTSLLSEKQTDLYQNIQTENTITNLEARFLKAKIDMNASAIKNKQIEIQILSNLIANNPFFLEAQQVQKTAELLRCKPIDLLKPLVTLTKSFARPPVSKYYVSVIGLGVSGNIYLGVNFEFLKVPLNQTVHAEQFLVVNARNHGETELVALALSAPPCGHCRQFFNEISEEGKLKFITPENPDTDLSYLLPKSFSPKELGYVNGLLKQQPKFEPTHHENPLIAKAIDAALASYAPYTNAQSGVAIKTSEGEIYTGGCLENVAYNPSLSPLQVALVSFIAAKKDYSEICEIVLAQHESAAICQVDTTKMVLKQIAPNAKFTTVNMNTMC